MLLNDKRILTRHLRSSLPRQAAERTGEGIRQRWKNKRSKRNIKFSYFFFLYKTFYKYVLSNLSCVRTNDLGYPMVLIKYLQLRLGSKIIDFECRCQIPLHAVEDPVHINAVRLFLVRPPAGGLPLGGPIARTAHWRTPAGAFTPRRWGWRSGSS